MVPTKAVANGKFSFFATVFSHILNLNDKQADVLFLLSLSLVSFPYSHVPVLPVLSVSMDNLNVLNAALGSLETYLITLNVKIVVLVITQNQLVHTQQPRVLNVQ